MIWFFKIAQVVMYCAGCFKSYFEIGGFKYFGCSSGLSTYVCKGSPFFIVVFVIVLEVTFLFYLISIDLWKISSECWVLFIIYFIIFSSSVLFCIGYVFILCIK
jgi:hypothetical protein